MSTQSKPFDCIFIPGGGLLPDGTLPTWTIARLNRAIEISKQTHWIAFLSGGTVHKPPPLTKEGYPIFESRTAAVYLIQKGVDPDILLTEISSYDTIGNAYFSRLLFSDPGNFQKILVISSDFHMARVMAAFGWIYSLKPKKTDYQLQFEAVPDIGLSPQILKDRVDREAKSLDSLQKKKNTIDTLVDFQKWFYLDHAAYSVQSQPEKVSGDALESY